MLKKFSQVLIVIVFSLGVISCGSASVKPESIVPDYTAEESVSDEPKGPAITIIYGEIIDDSDINTSEEAETLEGCES